MAKSKSGGKVARAAKAGGGRRARQTAERSLLFPAAMAVVVVLGIAAVFLARDQRDVTPNLDDHWHSAFGIYVCDTFEADLPNDSVNDLSGIHTHGDGLIHIHPFAVADRTGPRANLGAFFDESELELTDEQVQTPTRTIVEGETKCTDADGNEVDGELRVLRWNSASADDPIVYTERHPQAGQPRHTVAVLARGAGPGRCGRPGQPDHHHDHRGGWGDHHDRGRRGDHHDCRRRGDHHDCRRRGDHDHSAGDHDDRVGG
jgi:hypothetical protein